MKLSFSRRAPDPLWLPGRQVARGVLAGGDAGAGLGCGGRMSVRRALTLAAFMAVAGAASAQTSTPTPPPPASSSMPGMSMPATPSTMASPTQYPPVTQTVIVGPTGKTLVVTPAVLADLRRGEAVMINHGVAHTYEGVRLTELLRLVDAPTGARIHADADRDYLVVTGGDRFRAVFSLAETDGSVQLHPVILADHMDGAPLIAHDAPFRIVVDGDQKPARSVYAVCRIEVKVLP